MTSGELRIPLPDFDSLAPDEQRVFGATTMSLTQMLAHATGVAGPFLRFIVALNTSPLLSERQREIVSLRSAALADSDYVWAQHEWRARAAGMTPEEIEGVRDGRLEGEEGTLIRFIDELVQQGAATDATLTNVREFLPVQAVVLLIITVGFYQMMAGLIATAGLTPDPIAQAGDATQLGPYYEAVLAGITGDSSGS